MVQEVKNSKRVKVKKKMNYCQFPRRIDFNLKVLLVKDCLLLSGGKKKAQVGIHE